MLLCEKFVFDVLPHSDMYACKYQQCFSSHCSPLFHTIIGFGQTQPQQWHGLHSEGVLCIPE